MEVNAQQELDKMNLSGITGIVTSNKLLLDRAAIEHFPDLQWIARLGSGMEIIDTGHCDVKGIRYMSSPAGIANAVAEHVTGMLLSMLHHIPRSFDEVRKGQWIREANRGTELESLTVGIIGYGHTGSAVAGKLQAFTSNIVVYDKYKQGFGNTYIREVDLPVLQQEADILSFHVPLNNETRHYYDDLFLHAMKKPHILVNASRGEVADTNVILQGLRSGKITGASLDVVEGEKQIAQLLDNKESVINQLLRHNVLITPHIAGYSQQAIEKMSAELLGQLEALL